jgi:sulfoxide reductase heme-binding subunit YedZ
VLIALTAVLAFALPDSTSTRRHLSLALAYTSLTAILVTLSIGPLNVLRGRRNPLSTDLRRDAGLAAAIFGTVHTIISLTNHFGGDVIAYFFSRRAFALGAIRRDAFGLGTWIGLGAVVVLGTLGVISSDAAMRRLGRARWKRVQRSNYALLVLAAAHTAAFWVADDRRLLIIGVTAVAMTVVVTLQAAGAIRSGANQPDAASRGSSTSRG